ncbi:hypothetical protein [Persephonella sp.]
MNNKKQWTLNTVKAFYKEVEKRFENVQTKEEAVEVFRGLFVSDKHFYRHIKKHIIDKSQFDVDSWIEAKKLDEHYNFKFSIDYLKYFISSLRNSSTILYYRPDDTGEAYVVIYSKRNSLTLILEGNKLISIQKLKDGLEKWKDKKSSANEEIIEVDINEEIKSCRKRIHILFKRFINL